MVFTVRPGLRLILASASPRRSRLLKSAGLRFSIQPSPAEEPEPLPHEPPGAYAARAAHAKGVAVKNISPTNVIVLAADTIVRADDAILRKPASRDEAFAMLKRLNGAEHAVFTGYYLAYTINGESREIGGHEETRVRFSCFDDAVLRAYMRTGEPEDRAGGYDISGQGAFLAQGITGSFDNVAGLPLNTIIAIALANGLIAPDLQAIP